MMTIVMIGILYSAKRHRFLIDISRVAEYITGRLEENQIETQKQTIEELQHRIKVLDSKHKDWSDQHKYLLQLENQRRQSWSGYVCVVALSVYHACACFCILTDDT